jgi:hypothetical protein
MRTTRVLPDAPPSSLFDRMLRAIVQFEETFFGDAASEHFEQIDARLARLEANILADGAHHAARVIHERTTT